MSDKLSKKVLTRLSKGEKKLSRTEASRKYHVLSSESKEKADEWINNRFYLYSGIPVGTKLDQNNPEHKDFVEEWLNQRDIVMRWDVNWKTTTNPTVSRIFTETKSPTPKAVLEQSEGILEQRFSGQEFNQYLEKMLSEANLYTNPTVRRLTGRRDIEEKIATRISEKILGNETWLNNTLRSVEGRDALRALSLRLSHNENAQNIRQVFENKLEPYRSEILNQRKNNQEKWVELFPPLSKKIQEKLENEGYTVEQIYQKTYTSNVTEVRAKVKKLVTVQTPDSYGTRSDPYTQPVTRTERKDINIGGFSASTGRILNHSYFVKHGTIETDWDTQLALGEIAMIIGSGIRVAVSGLTHIILDNRATRKSLRESGEKLVKSSEIAHSDTVSNALDDTVGVIKRDSVPPVNRVDERISLGESSVSRHNQDKISSSSSEQKVDVFGETDPPELADTVSLIKEPSRIPSIKNKEGFNPSKLETQAIYYIEKNQTVPDNIKDMLGEDLARRLYSYGLPSKEINVRINVLRGRGKSNTEIRNIISDENKVFEYIRDTYQIPKHLERQRRIAIQENRDLTPNDHLQVIRRANKSTSAEINVSEGNIESAISGLEWEAMIRKADDPMTIPGHKRLQEYDRLAKQRAKDIVKSLGVSLGSTVFVYKLNQQDSKKDVKENKEFRPKMNGRY